MPPAGFEPTIPAGERSQNYALDRAATGTGKLMIYGEKLDLFVVLYFIGFSSLVGSYFISLQLFSIFMFIFVVWK